MTKEQQPQGVEYVPYSEVKTDLNSLVREAIFPLYQTALETAKRISDRLQSPVEFEEPVLATDRPEIVFGTKNLYTATSALPLEQASSGVILKPAEQIGEETKTHRGLGLRLLNRLLTAFGIPPRSKSKFVWTGPQVDGQQVIIENQIGSQGYSIDDELLEVFSDPSDVNLTHPLLLQAAELINQGKNPYLNPALRLYIDHFLQILSKNTGVRGTWFSTLEQAFKQGDYTNPINLDSLTEMVFMAQLNYRPPTSPSQAIVIGINPLEIYKQYPIMFFPIGNRHPGEIVPLPMVNKEAIISIYSNDSTDIPPEWRQLWQPFSAIPQSDWLGGKVVNQLLTSEMAPGISPRNSLCNLRYQQDPKQVLVDHLNRGNMVPTNFTGGWLPDNNSDLAQLIQRAIVYVAEQSPIYGQLLDQFHNNHQALHTHLFAHNQLCRFPSLTSH